MLRYVLPLLTLTLLAGPARAAPDEATVQLYVKKCSSCHGEDGKAETKLGKKYDADSFASAKWQEKHSDEEIEKSIREGKAKTKMKPFKDKLTPEQIKALVGVVRTFNPAKDAPAK